MVLMMKNRPWP